MNRDETLTEKIRNIAIMNGVDIIGFANPDDFENFSSENQPKTILENCKTVIIIGIYMYDIILDAWSQDQKTGKSFHYLDTILENKCHLLKEILTENGYISKIVPYNPGLFLKDSAVLAGLGVIGKNNLLLTNDFGSHVRLRAILTDGQLVVNESVKENIYCKDCNNCVDACPANALNDEKYDKEACLSYNLANLRILSKQTAIWCNICINSCPVGNKMKESNLEGYYI